MNGRTDGWDDAWDRLAMRYIKRVCRTEEWQQTARILAWRALVRRGPGANPALAGREGARRVRQGRDLQGMRNCRMRRDALSWGFSHGGGMEGLADRRPGPDRISVAREQVALMLAECQGWQHRMLLLILDGHSKRAAALKCGRHPTDATRLTRFLRARFPDFVPS